MKNIDEKEKKLIDILQKLRDISIQDSKDIKEVDLLRDQENQLKIEKNQMIKSMQILEGENLKLKNQVNELKKEYEISKKKRKSI